MKARIISVLNTLYVLYLMPCRAQSSGQHVLVQPLKSDLLLKNFDTILSLV